MKEEIEFTGGYTEEETAEAAREALGDRYEEVIANTQTAVANGGCGYVPGFILSDLLGTVENEDKDAEKAGNLIPHLMESAYLFARGAHVYVVFSEDIGPETLQELFPQICYLSLFGADEFDEKEQPENLPPEKITIHELEDMADDFLAGDMSFVFRNEEGASENADEFLGSVCGLESVAMRDTKKGDYIITSILDDDRAIMTGVSEKAMQQASYVFENLCEVDFSDKAVIASMMMPR